MLGGTAAPAGAAAWTSAARLAGPASLDPTPLALAFSPSGEAAVGLGFFDPEHPGGARASVSLIASTGRVRTRSVPHSRQVLDLAYVSGSLQLLTGTSGGGLPCCTQIQALALGAHGFSTPRPLVRGLAGVTTGRVIASGSGSLAVFGAWSGVWASRAGHDGRFGAAHRLTAAGTASQSLLADTVAGGGPLVAFAQTPLAPGDAPMPPTVMVSRAGAPGLPPRPRAVQTFPAGTSIGPLALAPTPSAPTLGWIEDVAQASGVNSSEVVLATVTSPPLRTRTFAASGQTASGLTGGASGSGDALFAWENCDAVPVCHVLAVSRPARGRFGAPRTLGTADADAEPALAVGPHGAAVLAWIQGGHIYLTRRSSGARRFAAPVRLPGPGPASELRLAAGPAGRMLAVWAAGTSRTTIWASELR